jgi:hypothetical protein
VLDNVDLSIFSQAAGNMMKIFGRRGETLSHIYSARNEEGPFPACAKQARTLADVDSDSECVVVEVGYEGPAFNHVHGTCGKGSGMPSTGLSKPATRSGFGGASFARQEEGLAQLASTGASFGTISGSNTTLKAGLDLNVLVGASLDEDEGRHQSSQTLVPTPELANTRVEEDRPVQSSSTENEPEPFRSLCDDEDGAMRTPSPRTPMRKCKAMRGSATRGAGGLLTPQTSQKVSQQRSTASTSNSTIGCAPPTPCATPVKRLFLPADKPRVPSFSKRERSQVSVELPISSTTVKFAKARKVAGIVRQSTSASASENEFSYDEYEYVTARRKAGRGDVFGCDDNSSGDEYLPRRKRRKESRVKTEAKTASSRSAGTRQAETSPPSFTSASHVSNSFLYRTDTIVAPMYQPVNACSDDDEAEENDVTLIPAFAPVDRQFFEDYAARTAGWQTGDEVLANQVKATALKYAHAEHERVVAAEARQREKAERLKRKA